MTRVFIGRSKVQNPVCYHYTGILVVEYKPTNKEKIFILLTEN
jgi:hypothetical protein